MSPHITSTMTVRSATYRLRVQPLKDSPTTSNWPPPAPISTCDQPRCATDTPTPTATPTPHVYAHANTERRGWKITTAGGASTTTTADFAGNPVLVRDDADINFNWGSGSARDRRAGRQTSLSAGNASSFYDNDRIYRFKLSRKNDAARVWFDERLIFDFCGTTITMAALTLVELPVTAGATHHSASNTERTTSERTMLVFGGRTGEHSRPATPTPTPTTTATPTPTRATSERFHRLAG